jgi:hypothetical protein
VERLSTGGTVDRAFVETSLGGEGLDVVDIRCGCGEARPFDHARVRLDADDLFGALGLDAGREACSCTEVNDEAWPINLRDDHEDLQKLRRRRGAVAVVDVSEAFVLVARALDHPRELAHEFRW